MLDQGQLQMIDTVFLISCLHGLYARLFCCAIVTTTNTTNNDDYNNDNDNIQMARMNGEMREFEDIDGLRDEAARTKVCVQVWACMPHMYRAGCTIYDGDIKLQNTCKPGSFKENTSNTNLCTFTRLFLRGTTLFSARGWTTQRGESVHWKGCMAPLLANISHRRCECVPRQNGISFSVDGSMVSRTVSVCPQPYKRKMKKCLLRGLFSLCWGVIWSLDKGLRNTLHDTNAHTI